MDTGYGGGISSGDSPGVSPALGFAETSIDTGHSEMIHDAQLDFYGKRLATCSSDRTIRIFTVDNNTQNNPPEAELLGHDGPVWQVSWGHPRFGSVLASCGFDSRVIIWKEASPRVWRKVYEYTWHSSSVNSIAFAPAQYGLHLACASADGYVSVLSANIPSPGSPIESASWSETRISGLFSKPSATQQQQQHNQTATPELRPTHPLGATSVSWAPPISSGALYDARFAAPPPMRLVSGGCDNAIRIWKCSSDSKWELECDALLAHEDWVRSVAWAPGLGLDGDVIASAGQDGMVFVWTCSDPATGWTKIALPKFDAPVWSVSWSLTGNVLGVASGDDSISLWKQQLDGSWINISSSLSE